MLSLTLGTFVTTLQSLCSDIPACASLQKARLSAWTTDDHAVLRTIFILFSDAHTLCSKFDACLGYSMSGGKMTIGRGFNDQLFCDFIKKLVLDIRNMLPGDRKVYSYCIPRLYVYSVNPGTFDFLVHIIH